MSALLRFTPDPGVEQGYVTSGVRAEYMVWRNNDRHSLQHRRWCVSVVLHGATSLTEHHDFRLFAQAKQWVREYDAAAVTA